MYKYLLKPILFLLPAEQVHQFVFKLLRIFHAVPLIRFFLKQLYTFHDKKLRKEVFGLTFDNPVGLAAGFDKNAEGYEALSDLGFGFIEIGTVTPRAQAGNVKPRLFRLPKDQALINRMGFNNEGVAQIVSRLKKRKKNIIIGGNIGKNKLTPNEYALKDYELSFEALFDWVDYFTVNVSSPNTPNLRDLQEKKPLIKILSALQQLNRQKPRPKPILLKIAPDLSKTQLDDIIAIIKETKIDGLIATNTTIDRSGLDTSKGQLDRIGSGGLSGRPLANRSTEIIRYVAEKSNNAFPIIGVGGIHTPEDALKKLAAGASLIQLYTGFVYEGPGLIKKINKKIARDLL